MKKDRSGIVHCFCMLKNNIVLHVCGYVTVTIFLLKTIKNGHRIDMSNIVRMSKKKKHSFFTSTNSSWIHYN